MKKSIIATLLFLVVAFPAFGELPFYNANQFTLDWDETNLDVDGDPIVGVTYKVYIANATTDPNKTNAVVVANPTTNQATITLTKGKYFVGVSAALDDMESEICWADVQDVSFGAEQFGLRFAVPPKTPTNIKR